MNLVLELINNCSHALAKQEAVTITQMPALVPSKAVFDFLRLLMEPVTKELWRCVIIVTIGVGGGVLYLIQPHGQIVTHK